MSYFKIFLFGLLPLTSLAQNDFVFMDEISSQYCPVDGHITLTLIFEIEEGYHIQANQVLNENFVPTTLALELNENLAFCEMKYSASKKIYLSDNEPLLVFNKKFTVTMEFLPLKNNLDLAYCLEGILNYQTCDGQKCFFPRDLSLEIPILINA